MAFARRPVDRLASQPSQNACRDRKVQRPVLKESGDAREARNHGDALRRQSEETTDVQWRRQLCTVFSSQWTPDYLRFERQQPRPPQPEFRSVSDQPRWNGTAADHLRSGFRWIPDVYERRKEI